MAEYVRKKGSDTWHFHEECQHFKRYSRVARGGWELHTLEIRAAKPRRGEFCKECSAKSAREFPGGER